MNKLIGICILSLFVGAVQATDFAAKIYRLPAVELGTLVSGMVMETTAAKGMMVDKGDVLLRLDNREFSARHSSAKFAYAETRALYAEAKREANRALELYERTLLSDHALQLAKIDLAKAEASMEQAKSKLMLMQVDLERTVLHAPFSGLVSKVNVTTGQMINNSLAIMPLISLLPVTSMRAVFSFSDKQEWLITEGMEVKVGVADEWIAGQVSALTVKENASEVQVEVIFPVQRKAHWPGQHAVVRFLP